MLPVAGSAGNARRFGGDPMRISTVCLTVSIVLSTSVAFAEATDEIGLLGAIADAEEQGIQAVFDDVDVDLEHALAKLTVDRNEDDRAWTRHDPVARTTLGIGKIGDSNLGRVFPRPYTTAPFQGRRVAKRYRRSVRGVFANATSAISACYGNPLSGASAADRLVAGVIVDAGGKVTSVHVLEDVKFGESDTAACARKTIKELQFPKGMSDNGSVALVYPWVFRITNQGSRLAFK